MAEVLEFHRSEYLKTSCEYKVKLFRDRGETKTVLNFQFLPSSLLTPGNIYSKHWQRHQQCQIFGGVLASIGEKTMIELELAVSSK